jgi:hypothetical protein
MSTALSRRRFLQGSLVAGAGALLGPPLIHGDDMAVLPAGPTPPALEFPHFASRLQAFVWRNWSLVPITRMAATVQASTENLIAIGHALGLGDPPQISEETQRRSFITVIRRNWHLLPYDQLLTLLDWSAEELAFTLQEDDFLYIKLGSLKPQCDRLEWHPPTASEQQRAAAISAWLREEFHETPLMGREPLFRFVETLSTPPKEQQTKVPVRHAKALPRFCYSYFALYGDALLDSRLDPYPDGYLARLANSGVNGVWLQGLLAHLAPFPWDTAVSARYQQRLAQLNTLVQRAARHGIQVYLYLNEPRTQPLAFFQQRPELRGLTKGDRATLCTSVPQVRDYLTSAVATLCRTVPDLAGLFTISASENLTNCWSHHGGHQCPRCQSRSPADVVAELHQALLDGIRHAKGNQALIAWDWGWLDSWAADAIRQLPEAVALMSVSEWDVPIERGGIRSAVGEYSLSAMGPGPRAQRHWRIARGHGRAVLAKVQVGNTWELASVPYIPAVAQAWEHGSNLRAEQIGGLMLGWTLGGHPSPNLEAAVAGLNGSDLDSVAKRLHGDLLAPAVVEAWRGYSSAFREFPFHVGSVYTAPWQMGPANLLWAQPTGYAATMVGLPYDDTNQWRSIYPLDVWCAQLEKTAAGFQSTLAQLHATIGQPVPASLDAELRYAEACALHWQSAAQQARWTALRDAGEAAGTAAQALLRAEMTVAKRLHQLQSEDSRIGFEASNHYFYVPLDLVEKVVQCRWLQTAQPSPGPASVD